jgi:hypothetical protein
VDELEPTEESCGSDLTGLAHHQRLHPAIGDQGSRPGVQVHRPAGGSRVRASSSVTRPAGFETTIRVPSGVDAMAPKFWGLRGGNLTMPKDDDLVGQRSSSRFDVPESVVICFATHDGTPAGAGLSAVHSSSAGATFRMS